MCSGLKGYELWASFIILHPVPSGVYFRVNTYILSSLRSFLRVLKQTFGTLPKKSHNLIVSMWTRVAWSCLGQLDCWFLNYNCQDISLRLCFHTQPQKRGRRNGRCFLVIPATSLLRWRPCQNIFSQSEWLEMMSMHACFEWDLISPRNCTQEISVSSRGLGFKTFQQKLRYIFDRKCSWKQRRLIEIEILGRFRPRLLERVCGLIFFWERIWCTFCARFRFLMSGTLAR